MEYNQTYTGTSGNDNIDIPTLFPDLVNNTWSIDALEGDDIIVGGSNNDRINGGEGADMMSGGEGDDLFFVDNVGDRVIENAGEGTDRVITSLDNYVLGDHVEELNLRGNAFTGYGNSLNNLLIGHFNTDDGDILFGGGGNDKIAGHDGNDELHGEEGNDLLNGGKGEDIMSGGEGNDIFLVDNVRDEVIENVGEGTDTVKTSLDNYVLADNVERLELIKDAYTGFGNTLDNVLVGHVGTNTTDYLHGNEGDDTITGDGGDDYLYGEEGRDKLLGGDGEDFLDGGADNDRLFGGNNDDYFVATVGDTITEYANEGIDTLQTDGPGNFTLSANVENLILDAGGSTYWGEGNNLDNIITGNFRDNELFGREGEDILLGKGGNDKLVGGAYHDRLFGGDGGDTLEGGAGNDYLSGQGGGVGDLTIGSGIDRFTGGSGADTFVLGQWTYGSPKVYYQGTDYAIIQDFNRSEGDTIEVVGSSSNYELDHRFFWRDGATGYIWTDIYYQGDRIAYVEDVHLNDSDLSFV